MKLNVLLALRSKAASRYDKALGQQISMFKNKQGMFQGTLKTHAPLDGYQQDLTKVANVRVATTVKEQFDWFINESLEYFNTALTIEAANGEGAPAVPLEFEGHTYGPYPATVLLRMRGLFENDKFEEMIRAIPVREDTKVWVNADNDEDYRQRGVLQTERQDGETRTTETHDEILKDPNLDPQHLPSNYRAITTQIRKTVKTGDYTVQFFTGEWTHEQRAKLLKRRSALLDAIDVALQKVNDREAEKCDITSLLRHLIFG